MKLGTCERCGYLTEERHDCDALLAVRAAVREAATTPPGDARFVGAEGNRDPLGVMRGREVEMHLGAVVGGDLQHGIGWHLTSRDPLRFRYNAETGSYDAPTPSAMLSQALAHIQKAHDLALSAGHGTLAAQAQSLWLDFEEALSRVEGPDVRQRYVEKHGGREEKP